MPYVDDADVGIRQSAVIEKALFWYNHWKRHWTIEDAWSFFYGLPERSSIVMQFVNRKHRRIVVGPLLCLKRADTCSSPLIPYFLSVNAFLSGHSFPTNSPR
jgi:hypothetical protein